jgi:hypothetical protein
LLFPILVQFRFFESWRRRRRRRRRSNKQGFAAGEQQKGVEVLDNIKFEIAISKSV